MTNTYQQLIMEEITKENIGGHLDLLRRQKSKYPSSINKLKVHVCCIEELPHATFGYIHMHSFH